MEERESTIEVVIGAVPNGPTPTVYSRVDGPFAQAIALNAVYDGGQIIASANGNPPSLGHSMESN